MFTVATAYDGLQTLYVMRAEISKDCVNAI